MITYEPVTVINVWRFIIFLHGALTSTSKCCETSAPIIGHWRSVTMNTQRNARFSSRSKKKERYPYVLIQLLFSTRGVSAWAAIELLESRGITLILAPVSTRKSRFVFTSMTFRRRHLVVSSVSHDTYTNLEAGSPVSYSGMCTAGPFFAEPPLRTVRLIASVGATVRAS